MNDGMVATATPPARSHTTRRGFAILGRDSHQAVAAVAIKPPIRCPRPVTAPASPTVKLYPRMRHVVVHHIRPQPQSAQTPPALITAKAAHSFLHASNVSRTVALP